MNDFLRVSPDEGGAGRRAAVTIEPLPGQSDEAVLAVLAAGAAAHVEVLAPGIISAEVTPDVRRALEGVAYVQEKPIRGLRGGGPQWQPSG